MSELAPISGYEGLYSINDLGDVYSHHRGGRILKPQRDGWGYVTVTLCRNNVKWQVKVHILVMHQFVGPTPEGLEINHRDGNKMNAALSNLEFITHAENIQHSYDTGLHVSKKGEQVNGAKLTWEIVREIRRLYATGEWTQQRLATKFHVDQTNISLIVNNIHWCVQ